MTGGALEVRRITGPIADRYCLRSRSGFNWVERVHRPGPSYLGSAEMALLRRVVRADLPVVRSAEIAVWPTVVSSELLSDRMLTPAFARVDEWWTATLHAIGRQAGALHQVPVTAELRSALPDRRRGPAWLDDAETASAVRSWRERLPLDLVPGLTAAADASRATARATVVVHGRLSAGVCVAGGTPRLLGWREAGTGDPCTDLAHFVADMVESASLNHCPTTALRSHVDAFMTGYREARGAPAQLDGLWDFVARRIIDHFAMGAWVSGGLTGVPELLSRVERYWADVRDRPLEEVS